MAKKREVYHMTHKPKGGWNVKKQGAQRSSGHFDTKDEAIDYGRELAKKTGLGQLKIHKQDGTLQTEYTYGEDPHPPKG